MAARIRAENFSGIGEEDFQITTAIASAAIEVRTYSVSAAVGHGRRSVQKERRECIWMGAWESSAAEIQLDGCRTILR